MSVTQIGWEGHAPTVMVRPPESEIYKMMWDKPEYRLVAPGEHVAEVFLAQAKPPMGASVIDFGCGTGRGSLVLASRGRLAVTMLDFADNCLDPMVKEIVSNLKTDPSNSPFIIHDLCNPVPVTATYGFCTDVMEHIPTCHVERVLGNILKAAQHVFFQISTVDDVCGKLIGMPLHLTIKPYKWWLERLQSLGAVVHWSKEEDSCAMFYVSAWSNGSDVVAIGAVNTEEEKIKENVAYNIKQGWTQVEPHETNDQEIMLIGGGPTLENHVEEIRQMRADGVKLIAMNGAYEWCLKHDIVPSGVIVVDARPFNARFTHPPLKAFENPEQVKQWAGMKFFIASQCDPSVFEGLPKDRTYIWHTSAEALSDILSTEYEFWHGVPGGSTVLLRAIPLFRMLGFKRFHLFGCDSCIIEKSHHAYSQPENDSECVMPVTVGEGGSRVFYCHAWMVAQAQEFIDTIRFLGDEIELAVYGDGLLKYILDTGAKLEVDQSFLQ